MMLRGNIHPVRSFSPLSSPLTKLDPHVHVLPLPIHSDAFGVNYQLQIFYFLQTISMQFGGALFQGFQYMCMVYERIINDNIFSIEQTIYINIIKKPPLASKIYSTEIFK